MSARWARLQSLFCDHSEPMNGFDAGSSRNFPPRNEPAALRRTNGRFGEARPLTLRSAACFRSRGAGSPGRSAFSRLAALIAIHGALLATGCSRAPRPVPANVLERFVPVVQSPNRPSLLNPVVVDRAGVKKSAMVLVAPIAVRAPLAGFLGRIELQLAVAPLFNVGDGIQMEIWLLDDGPPVRICTRYFDPGRRFEDRRWTPITATMDVHRRDARLEIRVSGGPEGNLTADWLAFADLHILSMGVQRQ